MADSKAMTSNSGDFPGTDHGPSSKQPNLTAQTTSNSGLSSSFNAGGALQQLSELLSLHAKGGSMNDFKGRTSTIPINDLRGDEAIRYSREERLIRCQLAALCRLIDLNGWTNSIYNQISAKCAEDEFLVSPFGLLYHEVQASTLVKINGQGSVLDPGSTVLGVNKAGWNLHSAVHSTRNDINCVAHVHLPDVVAVSCIKSGLLPVSPEAVELLPNVRYHDYAGIVTDAAEADAIRSDLGNAKILFLRNKGVTVAASTIPEAWYLMKRVISACQTQMRLLQLGCSNNLLNEFILPSTEGEETAPEPSGDNGEVIDNQHQNAVPFAAEAHASTNGDAGDKNVDESLNGLGAKSTSSGVTDLSGWGVGEMEFEAQMRMLDSAGYRTGYAYRNPNLLRRPPTEVPWAASGTSQQHEGSFSASGFLSDTTVAPEAGDVDDVTAANQAGAKQISEIASTVRSNKEKGIQRNQWLAQNGPVGEQPSFATHLSSQAQSTPMPNGHQHRHKPSLAEESVEELSTAAAVPPIDLSPPSTLEKSKSKKSKRKSGGGRKNGKKSTSPFSTLNRVKEHPEPVIEEPRTPPISRADLASRSASLPAHARNLVDLSARSYNTMEADGTTSDDELRAKVGKKKGLWGSFRFPTLKKKKAKQNPVAV
ncbi:hypothetical protein Aperf_G00000104396 [Anoplocephala perfoliata]